MAITSFGYFGSIGPQEWAQIAASQGADYGVAASGDLRVSTVPAADRTVKVAPGTGYGRGVLDVSSTDVTIQLNTLGSGNRWDLVGLLRTWDGDDSVTTVAKVTGTAGSQLAPFSTRPSTPGTSDFQPLALVQITAGNTVPTAVIDLRVWQANGGAVANDVLALQYLNSPGTEIRIGSILWQRVLDVTGTPTWVSVHVDTGMVNDATYGWIPRTVAGVVVRTLSAGTGANTLTLGKTVIGSEKYAWVMFAGDGTAQPSLSINSIDAPPTGTVTAVNFRYTGASAGNARINWVAVYTG